MKAQIGGQFSFASYGLPIDAKTVALGGMNITPKIGNVNAVLQNPALANDSLKYNTAFTIGFLPGQLTVFQAGYVLSTTKIKPIVVGIRAVNYGTIEGYDLYGQTTQDISANDLDFSIGKSMHSGNFQFGLAFHVLSSTLASENALAMVGTVGLQFTHPEKDLSIGLQMSGIGGVLKNFETATEQRSPLANIKIETRYKLKYAPFQLRFGLKDLTLIGKKRYDFNGNSNGIEEKKGITRALQYMVFGVDFIPTNTVQFHLTYQNRNRNFRTEEIGRGAGLNAGVSINTSRFQIGYGKAFFGPFGSSNQFTFQLKI